MVRTTSRGSAVSKPVAVMACLALVAGLAVAAPGHAATPSSAASRIVGVHHHRLDGLRHRTGGGLRR